MCRKKLVSNTWLRSEKIIGYSVNKSLTVVYICQIYSKGVAVPRLRKNEFDLKPPEKLEKKWNKKF